MNITTDLKDKKDGSFISATDIIACISMPIAIDKKDKYFAPINLGNIKTISLQTYRGKSEVRPIGTVTPVGFTGGPRTTAGTLVFSCVNKFDFHESYNKLRKEIFYSKKKRGLPSYLYADELPPFDIYIFGANENGKYAFMMIKGVTIQSDSTMITIEELAVDNQYMFKAIGKTPWVSHSSNELRTSNRSNPTAILNDYWNKWTENYEFVDIESLDNEVIYNDLDINDNYYYEDVTGVLA